MARTARTLNAPSDLAATGLMTTKEATKQEFGRRLYKLMLGKGWTQSDLARKSGMGKDSISTYIRGRSFPEPVGLQKLARALGTTAEELLPKTLESAFENEASQLELKQVVGQPEKAWLRVNRVVTIHTAARIIEILKDEK